DLRYPGDGYYDAHWERELVAKRNMNSKGIYVVDKVNHFYSLLYHALLHKPSLGKDYKARLERLGGEIGVDIRSTISDPSLLASFLVRNKYKITEPDDRSVLFQRQLAKK